MMNDHDLTLWAMKAGLTREEARRAVREGPGSGRIPWQTANETDAQVRDRMNAVQDYLKDQYLAGYDEYLKQISAMNAQRRQIDPAFNPEQPMAPWQWRQLPSHARARWLDSKHVDLAARNEYGRLVEDPDWVRRQGAQHLYHASAITEASFLARTGDTLYTTSGPGKDLKRGRSDLLYHLTDADYSTG
jgi:hypothetical protein